METNETRSLSQVRHDLLDVKIALQTAREEFKLATALAEQRVIDAAGGDEKKIGANEAARARALTIALAADTEYAAQRDRVRNLETTAERLQAELEDAHDKRREAEWGIRLRLAEGLDKRGVTADQPHPNGDNAFVDAAVEQSTQDVFAQARAVVEAGLAEMNGDDDDDPFAVSEPRPF